MFKSLSYDIDEVIKLFKINKNFDLRGLSNRLIREATIENDFAKAELGVIAYALHKIETKNHIVSSDEWRRVKIEITKSLLGARDASKRNDSIDLLNSLKSTIWSIKNIDSMLGNYVESLYEKAKVKQASLAYSYGLSINQAAVLTGADIKELQSYIGFTTMHDEEVEVKNLIERVNELKQLFKIGQIDKVSKAVIDSGTMITLSSTCLMNIFKEFIKSNRIELVISNDISNESVWKPITNKRFALNAARIKFAFDSKIV
ncbi:MAG: hypothetical protein PHQ98_04560, partial [Candidatus ainarchaeum sp.]|nr:hypothetical protein [Candidatus ainarchaeum sp.]